MRILDVQEFIACYKPLCAPVPSTNNQLKEFLGDIVIYTREYNKLANQLNSKTIWSIWEFEDNFTLVPGVTYQGVSIFGYVLTDIPYHKNDISNLRVIIPKE